MHNNEGEKSQLHKGFFEEISLQTLLRKKNKKQKNQIKLLH